jgi:hypothetical protein
MSQQDSAPDKARIQYEEEFKEWLDHPTTRKMRRWLAQQVEAQKEAWANGALLSSFAHEQFVKEAVAKGYLNACRDVLTLEAKELEDNEE